MNVEIGWLLIFFHYFLHLFCQNSILILCFEFLFIQPLDCYTNSQNLMMASSKVEIVSSASPFGCVLRDHNWRERINRNNRENCNNVQTNIKYFVHNHHFNANISDSSPPNNPQDAGEWLVNQEKNTISDETRQNGRRKREVSPNLSDESSIETNNMGCVSSLVQRWREFSDTRHVNKKTNIPNSPSSSPTPTPVSNADPSTTLGKSIFVETKCDTIREKIDTPHSEKFDTPCSEKFDTPSMAIGDDTFFDWESERAVQTGPQSRNSEDGGDTERLRVADVIRKLRLENAPNGNGTEIKLKEQEKRCFSYQVISSPPRFRGRQAFNDLLMQLERDRHMELDTLVERRAVSKFSHRGRIQSLLRLRFLRGDTIVRHHHQQQHSKVMGPQQHYHSTPAPAPQQPISSEESIIVDTPQISSSNPVGTEIQKTDVKVQKQERSVSNSIVEQNSLCEGTAIDGQHSELISSEHNQISQGSKVVLLREKFNILDKTDTAAPKNPRVPKLCNKSSSTSNQLKEELHRQQEVANPARTSCSSQNSVAKETEESSSPISDVDFTCSLELEKTSRVSNGWELSNDLEERDRNNCASFQQDANYKIDNICSPKLKKTMRWELSKNLEERNQNSFASVWQEENCEVGNICSPESEQTMTIALGWEDSKNLVEDDQNNQESRHHQILESGEEWTNNDVQYWNEWDEEDVYNLNWVSDIARPKSDWENLRQARYKDMLDSDQENNEMRRLLERRSVSSFLNSNLRDTMDQLMISRAERVPQSMVNNDEHRLEQFEISQIQTQTQTNIRNKEEEEEGESNFSDQVRYPSLEQPRSSQSSCPDAQPLSALTSRSSIDMEYMHDLKAYMEQLHQEVSELRKTVISCMNMQEKMQCSINQEVAPAVDLPVGRAVQGSANHSTRTRTCCLCYEMQVDSLLYRCGHMCTCFKCAHELQWSTGKCPICRAPIVDVVRAYPDSNFMDRR